MFSLIWLLKKIRHPIKSINNYIMRKKTETDKYALEMRWQRDMGGALNLKNPRTFNEKIQWLKLYDRKRKYTEMVDKYAVIKFVAKVIGNQYIIPTLAVYDKPEDIDWDSLPDSCVFKCTHDSGSTIVCQNKDSIDRSFVCEKLNEALNTDYYSLGKEWPYKNVKRRIIVEPKLIDGNNRDIIDYKLFCFGGKAKYLKIDFDRSTCHRSNYYDLNLNLLPFTEVLFQNDADKKLSIGTEEVGKMVQLAELLSKGIPLLRVDFYYIENQIYFSELTFYPACGFGKISPPEYDLILGDLITLPKRYI